MAYDWGRGLTGAAGGAAAGAWGGPVGMGVGALIGGLGGFGGGGGGYQSFNYPAFDYPEFPGYPAYTPPAWLEPATRQTWEQISAPAQYAPIGQDVISSLLADIQRGTREAGRAETYGLTERGLLRSTIGERLMADVARTGMEQERRFLGEVADIEAQRKGQAEQARLTRMTQFIPQQQQLAQQRYGREYERALSEYTMRAGQEQAQYQQSYQQALMNWQQQQGMPQEDYGWMGQMLGNIPWSTMFGGGGTANIRGMGQVPTAPAGYGTSRYYG